MIKEGLLVLLIGASLSLGSGVVAAQPWPEKPVRMVVPYPPGGATDFSARIYAEQLTKLYGQTFIVDNKAGAAGDIGAKFVAGSAPDGYTLLLGVVGSLAINSILPSKHPDYRFPDEFDGVSMATSTPLAVVVRSSLPVKNIPELIALAKSKPGALTYGSAGVGSSQHMTAEKFQLDTGARLLHVPYKGSGPAMSDLLGGQVDIMFDTLPTLMPHLKSDKVRFIGVTTQKQVESLPELRTLQEQGVKGFDISTRYGLMVPKGTPREIIEQLSASMQKIGRLPEVRKALEAQGAQAYTTTPAETDAALRKEVSTWADVVRRGNVH